MPQNTWLALAHRQSCLPADWVVSGAESSINALSPHSSHSKSQLDMTTLGPLLPFSPQGKGEQAKHMALDSISVLCRVCCLIPPHLHCLLRKGWPRSKKGCSKSRQKYPSWLQGRWEKNKASVGSERLDVEHP